jgi:hypothetical protein
MMNNKTLQDSKKVIRRINRKINKTIKCKEKLCVICFDRPFSKEFVEFITCKLDNRKDSYVESVTESFNDAGNQVLKIKIGY